MGELKEERAKSATLLSMSAVPGAGQVLGLKLCDIGKDRQYMSHTWELTDAQKCTKTGKVMMVPILRSVSVELIKPGNSDPHGKDSFIFYGLAPVKPHDIPQLPCLNSMPNMSARRIPILCSMLLMAFSGMSFHSRENCIPSSVQDDGEERFRSIFTSSLR
jgi:hypothetical protein